MKYMISTLLILLLLNSCAQNNTDIPIDDLAASISVIGNPFAAFGIPDDPRISTQIVTVTNQVFSKAWRFTTTGPFEAPYSVQHIANNSVAIAKDDVLLVRFWARAVGSSSAQSEFAFEEGAPNYANSVIAGISFGSEWKQFQVSFLAHRDFAIGEAFLLFRLAYPNQSFELGGLRLVSFQKTRAVTSLPSRGFEYPGIEAGAAWRSAANARIDQYRKANLNINVLDASGNSVSGATVKVEMQKHAFPFGSAIVSEDFLYNPVYQTHVLKHYNRVVLDGELQWTDWIIPEEKRKALESLDLLAANGITARGHSLIWQKDVQLPDDVEVLTDPAQIRARVEERLIDVLDGTQGRISEWDVVNEPSENKMFTNILGEDEMAAWFRRAKELDPKARLIFNDYANLGEGTLDTEYKRIIRKMLALGAPVEGIGLQGHFTWDLTPPVELYSRLNGFANLIPYLSITEFDVNISDEKLQAAYLRDFMTIAFSHPRVNSFLMWGFWEGQHWQPQAALYRNDWSIKPNGQAWKNLVFRDWWTNTTGISSATGNYSTRGFLGQYKITITKNGKTTSGLVNLRKGGSTFGFTLR